MGVSAVLAILPLVLQDPLPDRLGAEEPLQERDEELRRAIREKRHALQTLRASHAEEEAALKEEIRRLWLEAKGVPAGLEWSSARGLHTFWNHRLELDDAFGGEIVFSYGARREYEENGELRRVIFSPGIGDQGLMLSGGFRYQRARDERAGGHADILTYQLSRLEFDLTFESGFSFGGAFAFGLSRLTNRGRGGDHDTALDFSYEFPRCGFHLGRHARLGFGVRWGLLKTNFNQDETRSIYSVGPALSFELLF